MIAGIERDRVVRRLRNKLQIGDGCWDWFGSLNKGYGYIVFKMPRAKPVARSVYRLVYELLEGEIPKELQIDHLCRNRRCCNPAHLEPVTSHENTLRGYWGTRTTCINGHPKTPENVISRYRPSGKLRVECRVCVRESRHRHYQKAKTAKGKK